MKKILTVSILLGFFCSCVSEDFETLEDIVEIEIDRTNDNIHLSNLTPTFITELGEFGLLGYGYDVTGEYADINGSRERVFDIEKFTHDFPQDFTKTPVFGSQSNSFTSPDVESFLMVLSQNQKETEGLSLFKGTITSYFPGEDALSNKYVIGKYSYKEGYLSLRAFFSNKPTYVTSTFLNDIEVHSPKEIVAKYGTHVFESILLGYKLKIMYQAETDNIDREQAASLGLSVAMKNSFGLSSGEIDHTKAISAKGNYSQKIAYKLYGGDHATITETPTQNGNPPYVHLKDWLNSFNEKNATMIDFSIMPIYELVADPVKKEELKVYIEQYLLVNQVKHN